MLGLISPHVYHKVDVHERILSCAADTDLPIYKSEMCEAGHSRSNSNARTLVLYINDLGWIPCLDTFQFLCFIPSLNLFAICFEYFKNNFSPFHYGFCK